MPGTAAKDVDKDADTFKRVLRHVAANRLYIAGSATVILLYRQGVVAFILVVLVAFVATSFEESRHVVDALLGKTLSGRQRLDKDADQPPKTATPDTEKSSSTSSRALVDLAVPPVLNRPLTQLIDLVERDFVDYWYSSSVALTPGTPFPQYTRSLMNEFLTRLVALIQRQDAKLTALSLAQAASRLLCTEIAHKRAGPPLHTNRAEQINDFRRCSQKLVNEFVPTTAGHSAIVNTLLTEVLAMQLQATVNAFSDDYINQMIVANLGKAVAIAKAAKRDGEANDSPSDPVTQQAAQGLQPPHEILSARRGNVPEQLPTTAVNGETSLESPPSLPRRPMAGSDVAPRAEAMIIDAESPTTSAGYTYAASSIPQHSLRASEIQPLTASSSPRGLQESSRRASLGVGSPGSVPGIPTSPRINDVVDNGRLHYRLSSPSTNDRYTDKSIEDAIEEGAFKLKKFGKSFLNKAEKLLDHLEEEAQGGRSHSMNNRSRSLAGSLAGSPRSVRSVPLTSPTHSKQSGETRQTGTTSAGPQSRSGTPADTRRLVADLDLSSLDPSMQFRIERSLASRDLEYLLPTPVDEQFRAVLTRQSPRGSSSKAADQHILQLAEEFQQYLEQEPSGSGEGLHRFWIQLEHFTYMIEETRSAATQIQADALARLRRVIRANPVDYVSGSEPFERAYWTAVELVLLRLLQNPTSAVFEPLQEWLMRVLSELYWRRFLIASGRKQASPFDSNASAVGTGHNSVRPLDADLGSSMPEDQPMKASTTLDYVLNHVSHTPEDDDWRDKDDEDISAHTTHRRSASLEISPANDENKKAIGDPPVGRSMVSLVDNEVVPAFTITLTDISEPSAYNNDQVKNKRDLHFMIAVESEGQPGYILTRRYAEFEQMDTGIKKALPQSGTRDFPRAPLPATKFQTSANLCRSLEQYLTALLHDDRYATCEPVAAFFEKERTDAKGDVQPLAFLGRGVSNIGKGVTGVTKGIGKTGEAAGRGLATGLSSITTAVTTLPRLRKMPSTNDALGAGVPTKRSSMASLKDVFIRQGSPGTDPPAVASTTLTKSQEQLIDLDETAASPSNGPAIHHSKQNGAVHISTNGSGDLSSGVTSQQGIESSIDTQGYVVAPPAHMPTVTVDANASFTEHVPHNAQQANVGGNKSITPSETNESGRLSFDELLQADTVHNEGPQSPPRSAGVPDDLESIEVASDRDSSQTKSAVAESTDQQARAPLSQDTELNHQEYNDLLAFAMAVLEESYDVTGSTWNIRRSLLKVVESVLRNSYADVIKTAAARIIGILTSPQFYVKYTHKLTDSFWPPPKRIWWSSVPGRIDVTRTAKEKEDTRKLARQLLLNAAPDGLRTALGYRATTEAIGRIHDALQGEGAERIVTRLVLNFAHQLFL